MGLDALVVTGLPARGAEAEVHLGMRGQDPQKILKIGDKLSIGQVVMVDYRELPKPGGKPDETSLSRVILKIGKDYWAVEIGDALGTRRVLRPKELPDRLKPASAPGGASPSKKPTAKAAARPGGST